MKADLIVTNARVLTMDERGSRAEAVAIAGGRILAVGSAEEVARLAGPATEVIDGAGRTLLPGFFESHLHLVLGGAELAHLQLGGVYGAEALSRAFRDFAASHPDQPLLMAQGADYGMFGGRKITRADLDAVISDRPIAMTAYDHHTVWANTAALKAAGLLHGKELPEGHEVVMGPDGLASGELLEFEAFAPVQDLGGELRLYLGIATGGEPAPWPSDAERAVDRAKIANGLAHCAKAGVTSMVNMDGNRYTLELLREMRDAGELTARVKVPLHFKPHMELSELDRADELTRDYDDEWLSSGFVKMFMDGVMDSGTAFRLDDYPGQPGHRSVPLFEPERFKAIATEIDRRGLQIAVHAIGDGAVRVTIDGYEAAQKANGKRDSRHRIEHIELIDRADIPRVGALGITASMQPSHPPGAMDFPFDPARDMVGRDRWGDSFPVRDLVEGGAALAFASDWPVTDVSVLRNIQAALTRKPYGDEADQRVRLMKVLHAYTAGGAWAAHRDHVTGRIVPGLAGDLVLLGGDIEAAAPGAVGAMGIALTVCGGRITHRG
ncbi:MAG: hydrolase [Cereibacter sphaeroides]|uniref:Hydrolase n=1 Tax=Cereibacter sphaeroides TaxID=1063 RepID=A0A2W5RY76_CERSP|nr:MAG: hydrolase [Cereibacter sphaeroides]